MATKKETVEIAILNELDKKISEAAALVPVAEVEALEALAQACVIESDEDVDVAVARAGRALGWADKLEKFWNPTKKFHWDRYGATNTAIAFGVELNGFVVVGGNRLKSIRDKFEAAAKKYSRERDARAIQKQQTVNSIVSASQQEIKTAIEEKAAQGDMKAVRELRQELETVQPVVIMERPLEVQGAAVSEPCVWSLDGEDGMMALVKAVAAGEVPLYHVVRIKGVEERRCVFDLSDPVLNQSVRKMGLGLGWAGIKVEKDIKFAIEKR